MTAALIVLAVLLLFAIAALATISLRSQLAPGPSLTDRTVVVHTRDERSIRGLFAAQHADRVSLREAVLLHGSGDQPLGGLVHVPVASISWMQEIQTVETSTPEVG